MKKLFLLLGFLSSFIICAQETQQKNYTEIKMNGLSIALGTFEFEFERTVNSNSSLVFLFLALLTTVAKPFHLIMTVVLLVFTDTILGRNMPKEFF